MPTSPTRVVDADEMWTALRALPRSQRAVVVLRYYEDLPDAEIARLLGCAPATVRVHAFHALAPAPVRADPRADLLPATWRRVMSDVEHRRCRDLLQRHAADAPAGATLLTAVRTESRRRTRRTRVLLAAVVTVLVGVGVSLPLRLATAPVTVAAPSTLSEPATPATSRSPL